MPRYRRDHLRMVEKHLSASEREMAEYAKDAWHADNIASARIPDTSHARWIHFEKVPERFRPTVKQWGQFLLARFSFSNCFQRIHFLQEFLNCLVASSPTISTFADLNMNHIDAYLSYCRATPNGKGRKKSAMQVWYHLHSVRAFLEYLEINSPPFRTREPVQKVLGPHNRIAPKSFYRTVEQIKYIAEYVLRQFDQHIQDLSPRYIPLAIVWRATGWRISDVLLLKMDTCLEQAEKGWWICGDVLKTSVLGHKVPITREVAAVIEAQRELIRQEYSVETNSKGYLFPAVHGPRKKRGMPMTPRGVNRAFQELAQKYAMVGEDGKVFRIHTHAFRHTKAVELLNSNALDVERVREHRIAVKLPIGNCCKTPKIICRFVELPCFNCPAYVLTPADLPALEAYAEQVQQRIDIGKKAGQAHWVEANQGLLEQKVLPSIELLRQGQTIAKDRRIKELEEQNRRLKKDLQVALGKAYERL